MLTTFTSYGWMNATLEAYAASEPATTQDQIDQIEHDFSFQGLDHEKGALPGNKF